MIDKKFILPKKLNNTTQLKKTPPYIIFQTLNYNTFLVMTLIASFFNLVQIQFATTG